MLQHPPTLQYPPLSCIPLSSLPFLSQSLPTLPLPRTDSPRSTPFMLGMQTSPAHQELAQCSPPGHPWASLRGLWSWAASSYSLDPTRRDCSASTPHPHPEVLLTYSGSHSLEPAGVHGAPSDPQPLPVYPSPRASPCSAQRPPHRAASPCPHVER